jgi:hypothetical protein
VVLVHYTPAVNRESTSILGVALSLKLVYNITSFNEELTMTEPRKFYKTVVSYEILSEEPLQPMSLSDIEYECTDGHMSGRFLDTVSTELTGKEAADCLLVQGSDTTFFNLDEYGNDIDD